MFWWWAAFAGLVVATGPLVLADIKGHLLPNNWLLRFAIYEVLVTAARAAAESKWSFLLVPLAIAVISSITFGGLALISRGAFGLGDAKLISVLALTLGQFGLVVFLAGILAAGLIGGVVAVFAVGIGVNGIHSKIAYGPSLLAGAVVAMLASDWLANLVF